MFKIKLLVPCLIFWTSLLFGQSIIPAPLNVEQGVGYWKMPDIVRVKCEQEFSTSISAISRFILECDKKVIFEDSDDFVFNLTKNKKLIQKDSYILDVSENGVFISASSDSGAFYAIQTLSFMTDLNQSDIQIKQVRIEDSPRFSYRGFMLDSARHFQSPDVVKRLLNQMALLKMNKFHWHLVDNNGWRVPIKSFPELTSVGGHLYDTLERERNGAYSREDIRDIVEYARVRNIEVIPEIDIPGHGGALLEVFPQYLCPTNRNHLPVSKRASNANYHEILCVGNPDLLPFLETVFRDIVELFGCETIHIGGDEVEEGIWGECPLCSEKMDLSEKEHEYFMQRAFLSDVCTILHKMGVKAMNWSERVELGLPDVDIAQVWRGRSKFHLYESVKQGIPVVSSFGEYAYFDYPDYLRTCKSSWMPVLSLRDVYKYQIIPSNFSQEQQALVIGGEFTLWTEELLSSDLDEMLFPRSLAFAEQMWSVDSNRRWFDFKRRLKKSTELLKNRGFKFSKKVSQSDIISDKISVESSLAHRKNNYIDYIGDKNDTTAFISIANAKKGDFVKLNYKNAVEAARIEVITGGYYVYDVQNSWLDGAEVEISSDGTNFTVIGNLVRGQLGVNIEKQLIASVRIVCMEDYDFPMVVNEIYIE